ncbi:hypothetical protein [Alkalispirochaeta americana]|uniref:hypothetical protein n=1 Tax=Alkalispirochaeta americana TaxID=159291 RepID=UPI00117ABF4F|nr:hypothetical protein [Alkalispirochaeta americana]
MNYRKLVAGRIDAVLEERLVGLRDAKQTGLGDLITYNPKPIKADPYYLLVSRQHPRAEEIILSFNRGVRQLQADGRLDEILRVAP